MMKRIWLLLLSAVMLLSLLAAGCSSDSKPAENKTGTAKTEGTKTDYSKLKKVELIGADSTGKGAAGQIFGEYVAKRVKEITGGQLTIDYHPNGDLGGDADLIRQVQANDIQLVVCQTAPIVSFIPEMAVFDLPMVFSKYDGDKIDVVLNGNNKFNQTLSAAYDKSNMHLLGFLQNATYRLTTANKNLATLADYKGLQIRTMENRNHMDFWTAIGAEPTPLAWAELYIALQNGTVAAQENAADSCVGASFQEVQKYLACTNHILYCNQICMSKEGWNKLDPAYQAAIKQAVADAIAYMRPQLKKIDTDNKAILVKGGMKMIEYKPEFYDQILAMDKVKALYENIDKKQVKGLGTLLVEELKK